MNMNSKKPAVTEIGGRQWGPAFDAFGRTGQLAAPPGRVSHANFLMGHPPMLAARARLPIASKAT
jgi:hypothetical protein